MCYLCDINRALFFWLNLSHEHKELKHIQLDSSLEEILRLLWMMCVFRCSGWTCFTEKCFSCVFIVTFQVISERNLDGYCSTQIPPNCNSWQSGGDCFDCITPLLRLCAIYEDCFHVLTFKIACLRDFFFNFLSEVISHNNNNNKVVIDSLSFVLYKLPSKVTVIAPCCVMQMKVCGNMHFHRATFMPEI